MRSAVLRQFGRSLSIEERKPSPGKGPPVKVSACGVCHTDVHIWQGAAKGIRLPLVMGHEIAGFHEKLGNVLVYPNFGCGRCDFCSKGDEQLCDSGSSLGFELDGGYSNLVRVPSTRYLIPFRNIRPERAAPLMDAGITPYRALKRLKPFEGNASSALVIGFGALGQFALQHLRLMYDCDVTVVDRSERKLRLASRNGASKAAIPKDLEGKFDIVLDFVGSSATLASGMKRLRKGGALALIGEYGGSISFSNGAPAEGWLTTSVWGSIGDAKEVVALAERGKIGIPVTPMPLERASEALAMVRKGEALGRVVLVP